MLRALDLRGAVAVNVATMIGAGPLITIPLVVIALHGSISLIAWILGALIAMCDGLVWAELASRYPRSGGTYVYLRATFGPQRFGRLWAFLFVWQYCLWAPLTLASGYIGFAQYAAYLVPALNATPGALHAVAIGVGIVTVAALLRAIPIIARTTLVLGAGALGTLIVIAGAGFSHPRIAFPHLLAAASDLHGIAPLALGAALIITLYDYGGYNDACLMGDEVIAPTRTIPRAVIISIGAVALAYIALNLGVFSILTPQEAAHSTSIATLVVERAWGRIPAIIVTCAVLITAFASTYGLLLGAARVPYAAARDGDFLAPFARLHPRGRFPMIGLLALGGLALPLSLLPLDAVIAALTAGIALVQGIGGALACIAARMRHGAAPFRIPAFALVVVVALGGWGFLFVSSGTAAMVFGATTLALGAGVFFWHARLQRSWPFAPGTPPA